MYRKMDFEIWYKEMDELYTKGITEILSNNYTALIIQHTDLNFNHYISNVYYFPTEDSEFLSFHGALISVDFIWPGQL